MLPPGLLSRPANGPLRFGVKSIRWKSERGSKPSIPQLPAFYRRPSPWKRLEQAFPIPRILEALSEIRTTLEAQSASLASLHQRRRDEGEHGLMILRRLTDLERAIHGRRQDIGRMPHTTRRQPLA
jgi:hypothetical protein